MGTTEPLGAEPIDASEQPGGVLTATFGRPGRVHVPFHHVPALDGIRAVAVIVIVVYHLTVFNPFDNQLPGGHLGVDLFFVLSGFLIATLLLQERIDDDRIRIGGFYRRRALRLLPPLFVFLLVDTIYAASNGGDMGGQTNVVLSAALYFNNWTASLGMRTTSHAGHLWSLSVEEQFYLLWPLLVWALAALRLRVWAALAVVGGLIVGCQLSRWVSVENGESLFLVNLRTQNLVDVILIGAFVAIARTYGWFSAARVRTWILPILGTIAAVYMAWCFWFGIQGDLYESHRRLFAVAAAIVILAAVDSRWFLVPVLAVAPMRAIGRISYAIYLWHFPVFQVIHEQAPRSVGMMARSIGMAITLAIATASWYLVERPMNRWKNRLEERSTGRHDAVAPASIPTPI